MKSVDMEKLLINTIRKCNYDIVLGFEGYEEDSREAYDSELKDNVTIFINGNLIEVVSMFNSRLDKRRDFYVWHLTDPTKLAEFIDYVEDQLYIIIDGADVYDLTKVDANRRLFVPNLYLFENGNLDKGTRIEPLINEKISLNDIIKLTRENMLPGGEPSLRKIYEEELVARGYGEVSSSCI